MDEIKEGLQELREKLDLNDEQVIILVATAAAAVVGTLVICGLCCRGGSRKVKKRADGKGPTGDGKAKLYHSKRLRSSRVAWLIQELDIKDDFKVIEFNTYTASPEEMEWYRENVNPLGHVPGLVLPDGTRLTESAAICIYLAQRYAKLLPEQAKEAAYYNWMLQSTGAIDSHLETVYDPVIKKIPEYKQDRGSIARSKETVRRWLTSLEKHFEDGRLFVCGEKFSAVDCVAGYTTMFASILDNCSLLTADDFPNVSSYLSRLKKRPAFAENVGLVSDWP